ncbi:YadA family autotransporter adhesin [Caballeronia insecticola]|uniref:YadA domain protein n=1 Tax=Caballeronia insecticola TaxID=758793 RepID=R4WSH0_9BURK|nr:YadA-like family protein [Caballeronia insecticola]BAN21816.1 YadA domain protein [Caballeronia insecticola]
MIKTTSEHRTPRLAGAIAPIRSSQRTKLSRILAAISLSLTGLAFTSSAFATITLDFGSHSNNVVGGRPGAGVAIGYLANADSTALTGSSPVAIGATTNASGAGSQVAIGDQAVATGTNAIAIGGNPFTNATSALGDYAVSIGSGSHATGYGSLAFGADKTAGAQASGQYALAFGARSVASGNNSFAFGTGAAASADNALAFGTSAAASGQSALAFGNTAAASGDSALAFGKNAQALNANDVALGSNSVTAAAVGTSSVTINGTTYAFQGVNPTSTVSIGAAGAERTLTNVAAGRIDATSTDAVNGSQLNATNLALAAEDQKVNTFGGSVASALGGGATFDPASGQISAPVYGVYGQSYTGVASTVEALQNNAPLQYSTSAAPTTGLGAAGQPVSNDVTLVGPNASAPVTLHNVATGVAGTDAVNVAQLKAAIGGVVINVLPPSGPTYVANNPVTYVAPAASGSNALAVGSGSTASGTSSTAVGGGSVASGASSTAIGNGAGANADNSIALGANSVANQANTVSVGSVGNERRVTNVAPAVNGTDAVNLNQLNAGLGNMQNQVNNVQQQVNDNLKKSYGGTAAAIAIAALRYDDRPGKISAGAATGVYHNQMGLAIGIGGTSNDGTWRVNGGITMSPTLSSPDFGGAVGVTHTFN